MRFIIAIFVLALAACTTVHQSYAPDGKVAYTINCSEPLKWDSCFAKAGNICGSKGYDILERSDNQFSAGGEQKAWGAATRAANPSEHTMLISCKQ